MRQKTGAADPLQPIFVDAPWGPCGGERGEGYGAVGKDAAVRHASAAASRLRHALETQDLGQPDDVFRELFGQVSGQDRAGLGSGLAETAPHFIGADRSGQGARPPAGGGSGALEGTVGSGAVALLSGLALSALGTSQRLAGARQPVPLELRAPQDAAEAEQVEQSATLILAAMINAAKADGQVDQEELQRIVGKLREAGADAQALDFVRSELRKPMDLEGLISRVPSKQTAVQLYAASLLAIEVDTEAERRYLRRLAHGLGLDAGVVRRVHECLGMGHA